MTESHHAKPNRGKRAVAAALLATTIFAGGGGWLAARAFNQDAMAQTIQPMQPSAPMQSFADLVQHVRPAVVNIATTEKAPPQMQQRMPNFPPGSPFEEFFKQFFDQQQQGPRHALGSGFLIDSNGYIVTNNHVVKGATKIEVTLSDGSTYPAEVKGTDPKTDVALLKIDAKKDLPHVVFGDSDKARIGDWVVAVGNPFGLGGSVTAGIISASGREISAGPYDNFLQIDAPINPGNSGGPVFNQKGEVIGISSAIYTPSGGNVGIGFAIPSKLAGHIVDQLKSSGKVERGWLGVQMQPMTDTLAKAVGRPNDKGVIVSMVTPDSPAEKGGVKQGDVIIGIEGKTIEQPRDLALAVADLKTGDKAKLQVWRNGKEQTLNVTIGSQPADQTASAGSESSDDKVGLALAPLTPELRGRLGLEKQVSGVVVADVASGSRAEESGVHEGDVITQVGGEKVSNPEQVATRIRSARQAKKEAITLLVLRGGTTYYLALPLA